MRVRLAARLLGPGSLRAAGPARGSLGRVACKSAWATSFKIACIRV